MSSEPTRAYSPSGTEGRIYQKWLDQGSFHAVPRDPARPTPYAVVIPPPNVTGALHLGHAINNTLQDILVRRKRMQGCNTLWMPGVDHAGIATQAVVERQIFEKEKKSRHDLGRQELVRRIWEWKEQYGSRIVTQLKLMGCSCDWQRERFTLDEVCARAVREWFFRLFNDGLIFRGKRLVNWDTHLQTAVADDEVYHETVKGSLWHIRYPLADSTSNAPALAPDAECGRDYLIVATTRPETMLADTAVAVHPEDERYRHLIGRQVALPLTGRMIPIIADGLLVKREFGTGCVKVTPGHDPNDYACNLRNPHIGIRNMMTPDGKVSAENAGADNKYAGMKLDAARKAVVADLEAAGLLEKTEPYETQVGHSDRSKTPIQPYLSDQWFVRMGDVDGGITLGNGGKSPGLAQAAMDAVCDDDAHYDAPDARAGCDKVHIFPRRYVNTYRDWLAEKRDWCISRQLWWGHRIPVWSRSCTAAEAAQTTATLGSTGVTNDNAVTLQTHALSLDRVMQLACVLDAEKDGNVGILESQQGFVQDPDVLDTWFSSALWPLSTMGWPAQTLENQKPQAPNRDSGAPEPGLLSTFYPTALLSTAREIITLWVARMVIAGLHNVGRVPFRDVFIHPVIQDGQGRQMKKSLGNGVDPVDIIDMYGADALRFTLAGMTTETQDVRIPVKPAKLPDGRTVNSAEKFELGRNFCNKLWQASTGYILPNVADVDIRLHDGSRHTKAKPRDLPLFDRWIRTRLNHCIDTVNEALDSYQFARAADSIRDFFWNEFCDWYLEESKIRLRGDAAADANDVKVVLLEVLDTVLCLLHPFTPFISEAIWEEIGRRVPRHFELIVGDDVLPRLSAGGTVETPPLIHAPWPRSYEPFRAEMCERHIGDVLQPMITALRQARTDVNKARSQLGQSAVKTLPRALVRADASTCAIIAENAALIQRLGGVDAFEFGHDTAKPPRARSHVGAGFEAFVPVEGLIDLAVEQRRIAAELDEKKAALERARAHLANEGFATRAAPEMVQQARERVMELERHCALLERHAADLE